MTTVTQDNVKAEIERRMSEVVDLLAGFVPVEVDPRAWQQLLIYAPHDLIDERHLKIHTKTWSTLAELEQILNSESDYPATINPDGSVSAGG